MIPPVLLDTTSAPCIPRSPLKQAVTAVLQRSHAGYGTDEEAEGGDEPSGGCGNDAAWPPSIGCALDLLAEAAALSEAYGSHPVVKPTAADAASGGKAVGAAAASAEAAVADAPAMRSASATVAAVLLLSPQPNPELLRQRGGSMDGSDCGGDGGRKRCRSPSFLQSGEGRGGGRGDFRKHLRGAEQLAGRREGAEEHDGHCMMAAAIRSDRAACSADGESEETAALTSHEDGLTAADSAFATAAISLGREDDAAALHLPSSVSDGGYAARCGTALQLLQAAVAALPGLAEMAGSQGGDGELFEGLPQVMERLQAAARCLAGEPLGA